MKLADSNIAGRIRFLINRMRKNIKSGLKGLAENPYIGKPLKNELAPFRSLKLKRFRVIYRTDDDNTRVVVVAIGHRKDIYEVILQILG